MSMTPLADSSSMKRLSSQQKLENAQQEIDNHPRWVRWHADGLLFSASDISTPLALVRSRNDVGFEVLTSMREVSADPHAPACAIEAVFGVYELPSGPYVALVLESSPVNDWTQLREAIKIGVAPIFASGRRLNSQMRQDEALELRLLARALREHAWLICPDAQMLATHSCARYSTATATHDEDRYWWNRDPHARLPAAWCLRSAMGASSRVVMVDSSAIFFLTRIASDDSRFLETEIILASSDATLSAVFIRCTSCDEARVDALLKEYGVDCLRLVVAHDDTVHRSRGADLASLRRGGKVRVIVVDADHIDQTLANAARLTSLASKAAGLVVVVVDDPMTARDAVFAAALAAVNRALPAFRSQAQLRIAYDDHLRRIEPNSNLCAALFEGTAKDADTLLKLGGATAVKHTKLKIIPAATKVHALERLDIFAAKIIVIFILFRVVVAYVAPNAAAASAHACAVMLVAQALINMYCPRMFALSALIADSSRFVPLQ